MILPDFQFSETTKAHFHLPGLFEFYDFYSVFLPLFYKHKDWFYDWAQIDSIYGSPAQCIWGGGREGFGQNNTKEVLTLLNKYHISGRLTFSNSLLTQEHLNDKQCNRLCQIFSKNTENTPNGVIIYSDLLLNYIEENYPSFYFVSSTTKVLTKFDELLQELNRPQFKYVVPDFRLNKDFKNLNSLSPEQKAKIEFLCNECCWTGCMQRKECYKNVSEKTLGINCKNHICKAPGGSNGYIFSKAMENPSFIGIEDILKTYLPQGFINFKIEGRGLGSAILLEMLLYYLAKPQFHLKIREAIYLSSTLDLF